MSQFETEHMRVFDFESPGAVKPDFSAVSKLDDDVDIGIFTYNERAGEYIFEVAEGGAFSKANLEEIITVFPKLTELEKANTDLGGH